MNKENSSRKANVVVRSPYKTRAYTTKHGISVEEKKKKKVTTATKKVKEVKVKEIVEEQVKPAKQKAPKKTTKVEKTAKASISDLANDTLALIFEHVGVYDTIWNASRVCRKWNEISKKESLATKFIKTNDWTDDFALCKKIKEHKTHYEHCFRRVTVCKFFEKVHLLLQSVLPEPPAGHTTPVTQKSIRQQWKKLEKEAKIELTMPWQYMEFAKVFNGAKVPDNEFEAGVGYWQYDDAAKEDSGNAAWVVVNTDQQYSQVMLLCDKDDKDFGHVFHWNINEGCGIGSIAKTWVDFVRGLYINYVRFMKKFNVSADRMKWVLQDEEIDHTPLDFLTNFHSWLKEEIAADAVTQEEFEEYVKEREEVEAEEQEENEEDEDNEEEEENDE